jgi:hypothetical protein
LSNEEKTNDYENFEKGMIYMKILKKGGGDSREKGEGGNEIYAPCACGNRNKKSVDIQPGKKTPSKLTLTFFFYFTSNFNASLCKITILVGY